MRLQEIRDPEANPDALESDVALLGVNSTDDLVFNDVLLRALESIRPEFHERTWQAFWKVVIDGRSASDVAADLAMKPGTVRVSKRKNSPSYPRED